MAEENSASLAGAVISDLEDEGGDDSEEESDAPGDGSVCPPSPYFPQRPRSKPRSGSRSEAWLAIANELADGYLAAHWEPSKDHVAGDLIWASYFAHTRAEHRLPPNLFATALSRFVHPVRSQNSADDAGGGPVESALSSAVEPRTKRTGQKRDRMRTARTGSGLLYHGVDFGGHMDLIKGNHRPTVYALKRRKKAPSSWPPLSRPGFVRPTKQDLLAVCRNKERSEADRMAASEAIKAKNYRDSRSLISQEVVAKLMQEKELAERRAEKRRKTHDSSPPASATPLARTPALAPASTSPHRPHKRLFEATAAESHNPVVMELDTHYVLQADLPGLVLDLKLTLEAGALSISGVRHASKFSEHQTIISDSRPLGAFLLRHPVDPSVSLGSVQHSFKNGELTITVPKPVAKNPDREEHRILVVD